VPEGGVKEGGQGRGDVSRRVERTLRFGLREKAGTSGGLDQQKGKVELSVPALTGKGN